MLYYILYKLRGKTPAKSLFLMNKKYKKINIFINKILYINKFILG